MREKTMDLTQSRASDLDGSTQLDEILNELLNEKSSSTKKKPWLTDGHKGVLDQPSGSITTQSGNSRTIISWQTNQAGPKRSVTVTSQMGADGVDYGRGRGDGRSTWDSQTMKSEARSWKREEYDTWKRSEETLRRENEAMSPSTLQPLQQRDVGSIPRKTAKTPPPPPARRRLVSADELGVGMQGSCLATRPATARREDAAAVRRDLMRNCASDSEETRSWLDEQMWKLESKRAGKSYQQHSRLEKQLISDLRSHLSASGKYTATQSDTEEHRTMSPPRQQQQQATRPTGGRLNASSNDDVTAKPPTSSSLQRRGQPQTSDTEDQSLSPRQRTVTRQTEAAAFGRSYDDVTTATTFDLGSPVGTQPGGTAVKREPVRSLSVGDDPNRQTATYKTKASFYVSGIERPAFSTHQTKYTFSVNPIQSDDEALGRNKQPPVPPPRSSAPTSPLIPKRGDSSRDAVQRSQKRVVCSPTLDDLEKSLRLILEQTSQSPPEKELSDQRKVTSPAKETVDDEVIVLKPIGPGVQTLEPEKDGTLRRRPFTPLIPLSVTNNTNETTANKGPISPHWLSADNVSPQQQGQFNQQGQVRVQYSTETIKQSQPPQTAMTLPPVSTDLIMTSDQQWLQQQLLQQQLLLQQQQLQQQPWQQQQQQPWQQPQQQQSWQQHTWQRQQSWPLQTQQQPQPMLPPQSYGTLNRAQGVGAPFNQVQAIPSQATFQTTQVSRQEFVQQQQPATTYNLDATQQNVQPLFVGVQKTPSFDVQQGNTLPRQQPNQQVFVQSAQQLNSQQLNSQQLNSQQLNSQQLNAQQLNSQQLMGSQHQLNVQQPYVQQMGLYQTLPQFPVQQGVQQSVQQSIQQGVQQPISVQQRETAKYMTFGQTVAQQQGTVVGQAPISGAQFAQQMQNQGQQVQQQMQQQQQQQQAYSRVLHESSSVDQGGSNTLQQNGRQGMGGSMTLDTRAMSPVLIGSCGMSPGGSWPSVGYSDTMRSQTMQVKRTAAVANSQDTLLRTTSPASVYSGQLGNGSIVSLTDGTEYAGTMPRFVRDTSKYWHKPHITREEAINLLKDKPAGSFVVRNSTTFQGGYGLALKVAQLPPNVQAKGDDPQANLVRHFLIESSSKGVRLKGCSNEPVFGSLAQLVYQHSITPLALPCKLLLPGTDSTGIDETDQSNSDTNLLVQGPACNALYVDSVDTESLTGPEALSKAISAVFGSGVAPPKTTTVQFKVSYQGITLTDNKHRIFFRRHYPLNTVTFCGVDGKDRRWTLTSEDNVTITGKLFGFVARKSGGNSDNACHLFLDSDKNQSSASTIVGLVTKVMMGQGQFMKT